MRGDIVVIIPMFWRLLIAFAGFAAIAAVVTFFML
jgi:hypothetical protein